MANEMYCDFTVSALTAKVCARTDPMTSTATRAIASPVLLVFFMFSLPFVFSSKRYWRLQT
jgi:hypothetical protein